MSEIIAYVGQYLDADSIEAISRSIGADKAQTEQAIGAALPTLLGAVTRNASQTEGAESLHQALLKDHDGSIFDSLGSLLGGGSERSSSVSDRTLSGGAILDHILGRRRDRVEDGVSRASGLSAGQTMKLMMMLAPLLMGALGKRREQDDLSPGGLGDLLRREEKEVGSKTLGGGLMGRLFDQDGDGDFDFMDVMKFGTSKIFGRK